MVEFDKLGLGAPAEITGRMALKASDGRVRKTNEEKPREGYLEFYGPDAEETRAFRRKVEINQKINDDREKRRRGELTEVQAEDKVVEEFDLLVSGCAARLASWLLVDDNGDVLDVAATPENAKKFFATPAHEYIVRDAVMYLSDAGNFTPPKRETSSRGRKTNSKARAASPSAST